MEIAVKRIEVLGRSVNRGSCMRVSFHFKQNNSVWNLTCFLPIAGDESEDFHPLGASQLELNQTGQGASGPINWNENFAMEKTGWEGWNEKPLEESSRRELNWDDWRMDSDEDSKKFNHPPVISDDLIV
jgi:hypothetical protein